MHRAVGGRLAGTGLLLLSLASPVRAAAPCHVHAPALGADLQAACVAVKAAVPGWDGTGTVQVVDADSAVAADTVGSTVHVHAAAWRALSPAGRQEVLTHELVHVATAAITTPQTPTWLVEGLAEAVAVPASGLADRTVGQELAASGLPGRVPTDADFQATPAVAYQEAWLAASLLLHRHGAAWLLRHYRYGGPLDADLEPALRAEISRRLR